MPLIPSRYELTPEEYQEIQARFQKFGTDFVNYIAEMQVYKHDTDGQLGDQYSRLDELKAGAQALSGLLASSSKNLSDLIAALRKDHESWRAQFSANDQAHDQKLGQLASQANALDGTIKAVQQSVNTLAGSVNALGTANQRQDERMDRMDSRDQAIEAANRMQDSAIEAMRSRLDSLAVAVQESANGNLTLAATVQALSKHVDQQTALLAALDARLKKLEPVSKDPATESATHTEAP